MTGVQRFLANNRNAVAAAVLTATSVKPWSAIFRTATVRAGNGRVTLTGDYTGDEDATYDVELAAGGGTPRVSAPTFAGVGSGTLSGLTVDPGTDEQTVTVKLANLGTDTTKAGLAIGPVTIQAKTAGAAGNAIYLRVNEGALVYTPADFALLEDWSAGTPYQEGEKWSWNSQPLLANGTLAPGTKRYTIGDDLQIFRPYRKYEAGKWRYYLTPTPERTLKKGARLQEVTGGRTVTVTSGATVEPYPDIVTLYDLLAALTVSDLVEVAGVVANDAAPDGQAAVDLPLKTMAYRLPVVNEGSANVRGLDSVTVAADAATENIAIACVDAGQLGREKWSVTGDVSGDLPQAITGLPYSAARFGFTVPERLPPEGAPGASFTVQGISYAARDPDTEIEPPICMDVLTLGAQAQSKTLTLTYRTRPPANDCPCEDIPVGSIDFHCLGLNDQEGYDMTTAISDGYAARLDAVGQWWQGFALANTQLTAEGELRSAKNDLDYAIRTRDVLYECMADIYGVNATRSWTAWAAATEIAVDAIREPTARNGYRYRATVGGTTDATTEPTWPTTLGATVVDNTVTWKCLSKTTEAAFDALHTLVLADSALLDTLEAEGAEKTPTALVASTAYTAGQEVTGNPSYTPDPSVGSIIVGDEQKDNLYKCIVAGTSSAYPSFYRGIGGGTTRGDVVWNGTTYFVCMGPLSASGTEDINTTNTTEPGMSLSIDDYITRYRAHADSVRAIGGILKKSDAGSEGSDCWQDTGDAYYWEVNGQEYLPAFSNVIYYASKKRYDADTRRWLNEATHEFAFAIKVKCVDSLKPGDTVTLAIGDTGPRGYQPGDTFTLPIVAAQDAYLAGGVTGSDTHTWRVRGSVDGTLADYAVVNGAETPYSDGGLGFTIYRGGIPFELGDTYNFAIEAGQYRWRKNGGAWSSPLADIPDTPAALDAGLSAVFTPGAAPSFAAGDLYSFRADQPNAPSHLTVPAEDRWAWSGTGATLTADLGTLTAIDALAIARHTLPPGATVTVEGSADGGTTWPLSQALTWREGVMAAMLATPWSADRVRLVVTGATGAAIGWWWAGAALALTHSADTCDLRYVYAMDRAGNGINLGALYLGRGLTGTLGWDTFLYQADLDALRALIDHVKQAGDEPFVFIPNAALPAEASLVRLDTDDLEVSDFFGFENESTARHMTAKLVLSAVIE